MQAEQITDPVTFHGEGAIWSDDWGGGRAALRFVDMMAGDVLTLRDDGSVDRLATGSRVAAMLRPRRGGGFVVATECGVSVYDASAPFAGAPDAARASGDLWAPGRVRFNDGGCTPDGTLLCGTIGWAAEPGVAALWSIAPDLSASPVLDGVTISNGLGFTPDGTRMYYTDTATSRIDVLDHSGGRLTGRRPFVELPGLNPDGLCVDAEGAVWTALYGAGEVRRYDASGRLTHTVTLPVSKPTSCAFGGPDLATLFVTTTREHLAPDAEPAAGALFAALAPVPGLPPLQAAL